jgi:histidinol phosphatase-like enzyme
LSAPGAATGGRMSMPARLMIAGFAGHRRLSPFLTCIKSKQGKSRYSSPNCARKPKKFLRYRQLTKRHERQSAMEDSTMVDDKDDDIPFMQKLLDNHFLLLFLGVASPGLIYILWGIIDIMNTPVAK